MTNSDFRYIKVKSRPTSRANINVNANRQFPVPGFPLSTLVDRGGPSGADGKRTKQDSVNPNITGAVDMPALVEMQHVISLVESIKPSRIASLHGKVNANAPPKKTVDEPGVFVDPRYSYDNAVCSDGTNPCKFNLDRDPAFPVVDRIAKSFPLASKSPIGRKEDDPLCLKIAKAAKDKGARVPGNHLDPKQAPPVVHYAQSRSEPPGFSLGDWGPVNVTEPSDDPGLRDGAPVITVEPYRYWESGAFLDGQLILDAETLELDKQALVAAAFRTPVAGGLIQMNAARLKMIQMHLARLDLGRARELRAHADALLEAFLELPAQ